MPQTQHGRTRLTSTYRAVGWQRAGHEKRRHCSGQQCWQPTHMQTTKEPAEATTCEDTSEHASQENTRHASATFAHARSLNTHSLALVPLRWTSPLHGTVLETWRNNTMTTRKPSNMIAHTFFSRVGSITLRSTARQTCRCPRRFSIACATNPAWAHKTYPPARRSMLVRNEHCLTASDTRVRITAMGHASSKESRAASCSHGLLFSQSHF